MPQITIAKLRSGTASLTWGQRSILRIILMLGAEANTTNVGSWAPMPDGTSVEDATRWITHLVEHYESIRTRYCERDGDWVQVLDGSGTFIVDTAEAPAADLATTAYATQAELRRKSFNITAEWQIRFRILVEGDRALAIAWASSHIVADLHGMWNLNEALQRIGEELPESIQPLDQVVVEQSEAGRTIDGLSVAYWREQIGLATSQPVLDEHHPPHEGLKFWRATFRSTALAVALSTVSRTYRTTSSAILFAAVAAAVAKALGKDRVTMTIVAANRSRRPVRAAVGTFSQLVPVTLDVAGTPWTDLVRQAAMRSVSALGRGAYDPRSVAKLITEQSMQPGPAPDLSMTLNDIRGRRPPSPLPALDEAELGEVLWRDGSNEGDSTLYLWIWGQENGECNIEFLADTRRLSLGDAEQLLREVEQRLLAEATPNVP